MFYLKMKNDAIFFIYKNIHKFISELEESQHVGQDYIDVPSRMREAKRK